MMRVTVLEGAKRLEAQRDGNPDMARVLLRADGEEYTKPYDPLPPPPRGELRDYFLSAAMITLTLGKDDKGNRIPWQPRQVVGFVRDLRAWLSRYKWIDTRGKKRTGLPFWFVWCAELQPSGAVHYHLMTFLPGKGLPLSIFDLDEDGRRIRAPGGGFVKRHNPRLCPYPDVGIDSPWWPYGYSKIEWVRGSVVGYMAKYMTKTAKDLAGGAVAGFPKGCRITGIGGLTRAHRQELLRLKAPAHVRKVVPLRAELRRNPGKKATATTPKEPASGWFFRFAPGDVFGTKWRMLPSPWQVLGMSVERGTGQTEIRIAWKGWRQDQLRDIPAPLLPAVRELEAEHLKTIAPDTLPQYWQEEYVRRVYEVQDIKEIMTYTPPPDVPECLRTAFIGGSLPPACGPPRKASQRERFFYYDHFAGWVHHLRHYPSVVFQLAA